MGLDVIPVDEDAEVRGRLVFDPVVGALHAGLGPERAEAFFEDGRRLGPGFQGGAGLERDQGDFGDGCHWRVDED